VSRFLERPSSSCQPFGKQTGSQRGLSVFLGLELKKPLKCVFVHGDFPLLESRHGVDLGHRANGNSHVRSLASHAYVRQAPETRVLRRFKFTCSLNLLLARADRRSSL
jgi:hypothetical protein